MTAVVPSAFALAGSMLMALAIARPFRRAGARFATAPEPVGWPALVGASAGACDAAARTEIVVALATLQTPWSVAVLREAYEREADGAVRAAIAAALSSTQSLVT